MDTQEYKIVFTLMGQYIGEHEFIYESREQAEKDVKILKDKYKNYDIFVDIYNEEDYED